MKLHEKLKNGKDKLIKEFFESGDTNFIYKHSKIIDDYFIKSFNKIEIDFKKNPYVIAALGGYGRQEQCIHSDIDILFLFEKKVPQNADELVYKIISPLWDIGIKLGYSIRSISESIDAAKEDMETLTSFLDSRYLCGLSSIYLDFFNKFYKKIISNNQNKLVKSIVKINQKRHEYFGDSAYRLEPNLKEGKGGLRDYHTILWIARIKFNLKQPRDLEYTGCLSYDEYSSFKESLEFIWNVRNRLHYIAKRKCDQLHMEFQDELARQLNFKKEGNKKPVEAFLGKLHSNMEFIKQCNKLFLYEQKIVSSFISKPNKKDTVSGLYILNSLIYFESSEEILKNPFLLIKIFEESARLKIPISPEAKRLITDFIYLIDDNIKNSKEITQAFGNILLIPCKNFNVLNLMLNTGALERLIPEIEFIKNLIQYNKYHIFPVDKHSLYTVRVIKNFKDKKDDIMRTDICGNIYKELSKKDKRLLLWAALLHDIGKGQAERKHSEAGAEIAFKILKDKGFDENDVGTVVFLVENHLFLIKTATRRDIQDESTAILCAKKIKKIDNLKMLYLLSVADCIATGPNAWNSWTEALLKDLFFKTLAVLRHGEFTTKKRMELAESKKAELISFAEQTSSFDKISGLIESMSPRYLLYVPAEDIKNHIALYNKTEDENFEWEIISGKNSDIRTVTFCGRNMPGLFSKIAGVFTLNEINILDAQIYTWRNNTALDIFNTNPPSDIIFEEEKWLKAKKDLKNALDGKLDLKKAIEGKNSHLIAEIKSAKKYFRDNVKIDNKTSSYFTIIEVITYNFPGVLFNITDAIFRSELDIWMAKIASKKDQVMDIFYVRDLSGEKIWLEEKIENIKKNIYDTLALIKN